MGSDGREDGRGLEKGSEERNGRYKNHTRARASDNSHFSLDIQIYHPMHFEFVIHGCEKTRYD